MTKLPLPFIGWKACEDQFYMDGCRITPEHACWCWNNAAGGYVFLPGAAKRIRRMLHDAQLDVDAIRSANDSEEQDRFDGRA